LSAARSLNPEKYRGPNIQIPKYPQDLSVETKKEITASRPSKVKFGADLPKNTALEATVKQDISGNGKPDHEQTIHLMDGEHIYRLNGFDSSRSEVWVEITFRGKHGQETASLISYGLYVEDEFSDNA
jgi:hypothetical protein